MRVRKLDTNGDYSMGHNASDWLVDSPACVDQVIQTSLRLFQGEWFLDINAGLPLIKILGFGNLLQADYEIKSTIEAVPGFQNFQNYQSYYNPVTRSFLPTATVNTIYGKITYSGIFSL